MSNNIIFYVLSNAVVDQKSNKTFRTTSSLIAILCDYEGLIYNIHDGGRQAKLSAD